MGAVSKSYMIQWRPWHLFAPWKMHGQSLYCCSSATWNEAQHLERSLGLYTAACTFEPVFRFPKWWSDWNRVVLSQEPLWTLSAPWHSLEAILRKQGRYVSWSSLLLSPPIHRHHIKAFGEHPCKWTEGRLPGISCTIVLDGMCSAPFPQRWAHGHVPHLQRFHKCQLNIPTTEISGMFGYAFTMKGFHRLCEKVQTHNQIASTYNLTNYSENATEHESSRSRSRTPQSMRLCCRIGYRFSSRSAWREQNFSGTCFSLHCSLSWLFSRQFILPEA